MKAATVYALVASLALPWMAHAQGLVDPMRPPEMATTASGKAPGGPVLQTVIIAGAQRFAVIDGETVAVGARVGDARVVRITETEVTLRADGATSVLKLYPAVEKKTRASPAAPAAKEAKTK
jgi:MSHA biogenesis protein MshK